MRFNKGNIANRRHQALLQLFCTPSFQCYVPTAPCALPTVGQVSKCPQEGLLNDGEIMGYKGG
jgi:hypothetical protein